MITVCSFLFELNLSNLGFVLYISGINMDQMKSLVDCFIFVSIFRVFKHFKNLFFLIYNLIYSYFLKKTQYKVVKICTVMFIK